MIASLPMYWRAENADLWRAFWASVQQAGLENGIDLPDLTPPEDITVPLTQHWLQSDLCLSMTCSLPFRTALRGKTTYVGTLDFGVTETQGDYASVVISRLAPADPHFGKMLSAPRLAYNAADSQSGWAVAHMSAPFDAPLPFVDWIRTGSHAGSVRSVAEGHADIAYIDAISWRILTACDPWAERVHVLGTTAPTPGLPLITGLGRDPAPLRRALSKGAATFDPNGDPAIMGGHPRFCVRDPGDYLDLPVPPAPPR